MRHKILSALAAFVVLLVGVAAPISAGNGPALSAYAVDYGSQEIESYALQVAAIVNRERAAYGLPLLKYSDKLSTAAQVRAVEIQSYFSHTRPNGTSCFTAVTEEGIRYRYVGENIAYGQRDPQQVMTAWMNSEGHRANILSTNVDYIGVGVTYRNGVYYWSQFFAASNDLSGEVITIGEQPKATTAAPAAVTTAAPARTTKARTTKATAARTTKVTAAKTTAAATAPAVTAPAETAPAGNGCDIDQQIALIKQILSRFGIDISFLIRR